MKVFPIFKMATCAAALSFAVGCGSQSVAQPVATPSAAQFPQNPNQTLSGFNSAQSTVLSAILGQYGGTLYRDKGKATQQSQSYVFTLSQSTNAADTGALEFSTDGPVGSAAFTAGLRVGINGSLIGLDTDNAPIYLYTFVSSKVSPNGLSDNPYSMEIALAMKNGRTLVPSRSWIKVWECVIGTSLTCTNASLDISFGTDLAKH